jgi:hypothetical protein
LGFAINMPLERPFWPFAVLSLLKRLRISKLHNTKWPGSWGYKLRDGIAWWEWGILVAVPPTCLLFPVSGRGVIYI